MSRFLGSIVMVVATLGWAGPAVAGLPGACCDAGTGECADAVPEAICDAGGGIYQGDGSSCSSCVGGPADGASCRECTIPAGAACLSDADCALGGSCDPVDALCPGPPGICTVGPIGAPCLADADCVVTEGVCLVFMGVGICVAGTVGAPCAVSDDCNVVGVCSPPFCEALPSCAEGACCDPVTGECTTTTPGACTGAFLGFGTNCDPNCCEQPTALQCMGGPSNLSPCIADIDCGACLAGAMAGAPCDADADCPGSVCDGACVVRQSGADHCEDAFIHVVMVPDPGDPAVVITISGDSTTASSAAALPDTCFPPSLDPAADRGWWEAFETTECATVRIDHCCSDPMHLPANRRLYDACPCGAAIYPASDPNIFMQEHFWCGDPYCGEGNLWATFPLLPAGTYYYPVHSSADGTVGPYQFHVTVEACPEAACCYKECAGAPPGMLCVEDADCVGFGLCEPSCVDGVNQLECDALAGNFLAPPQAANSVAACAPGVCMTGSCCTPFGCVDEFAPGIPMTDAECDVVPLPSVFTGGIRCFGGVCIGPLAGTSCDEDADCPLGACIGTPEELAQRTPCMDYTPPPAVLGGVGNVRSIAFLVPPLPAGPTAIRVSMIGLQSPFPPNGALSPPPDFSAFELASCCAADDADNCAKWVGPPATFLENPDLPAAGSFRGARLQCDPFYYDWSVEPIVQVFGAEILPSSLYEVQVYHLSCAGGEEACLARSAPVEIRTRRWGDVAVPFQAPAPPLTQPNGLDVTTLVNKFRNLPGAPSRAVVQLQPNVIDLNSSVNALDITAGVDAFRGFAYPYSGPCPCPSAVPCDVTPCAAAGPCVGLYGPGSTCVRTCIGGPNAGLPCNAALDCNLCIGGGLDGLPCNPALPPAASPCVIAGGVCPAVGVCPVGGFCRDACKRCG